MKTFQHINNFPFCFSGSSSIVNSSALSQSNNCGIPNPNFNSNTNFFKWNACINLMLTNIYSLTNNSTPLKLKFNSHGRFEIKEDSKMEKETTAQRRRLDLLGNKFLKDYLLLPIVNDAEE